MEYQGQLIGVRHIVQDSARKKWRLASNKTLLTDKFATLFWQENPLTQFVAFPFVAATVTLAQLASLPTVSHHPATKHPSARAVLCPVGTVFVPLRVVLTPTPITGVAGTRAHSLHLCPSLSVLIAVASICLACVNRILAGRSSRVNTVTDLTFPGLPGIPISANHL